MEKLKLRQFEWLTQDHTAIGGKPSIHTQFCQVNPQGRLCGWTGFSSILQSHREVQSFQESIPGVLEQSSRNPRNRQWVPWEHPNSWGEIGFISKVGLHFRLLAPFRKFLYIFWAKESTRHWTLLPVRSSSAGQFSVSYSTEIKYACGVTAWFCLISTCWREYHNESSHLLWVNSPTLAIRVFPH